MRIIAYQDNAGGIHIHEFGSSVWYTGFEIDADARFIDVCEGWNDKGVWSGIDDYNATHVDVDNMQVIACYHDGEVYTYPEVTNCSATRQFVGL